jgi:hypothetical protein
MSDPAKAAKAWKDFNLKFQPDASVDPVHNTVPGSMFEALDYRLYAWPGHGVSEQASYQYNEKEWMLPEEYDHLISDPRLVPAPTARLLGLSPVSATFLAVRFH